MTSVLVGFSTIWVVIGLGWLMARARLLDDTSQTALANLSFFLGTPALLFLLLARADLGMVFAPHLAASVLAMLGTGLIYVVSELLVWRRGIGDAVVASFGAYYVNAANIGIPIATYVLGDATWSVPILLVQVAFLQPLGLAVLDIHRAHQAGHAMRRLERLTLPLRNPITLAGLAGLAVNLLGIELPGLVLAPIELIGQLAVPTMLVAFGVSLFTGGFPGTAPHTPQVAWVVALKLVFMPALGYVLARWAFHLVAHEVFVVTVMAGLPTAQNVFTNAVRYRASVGLARDIVFFATVLSVPTLLTIALLAHG